MKRVHRERVEACLELISQALRGEVCTREEAVGDLERIYGERGVEPIRGWTKINIFDKEMCTVYVVARYGLGLDVDEHRDLYEQLLNLELRSDRAAERLKKEDSPEAVYEEVGEESENVIFRIARLEATAALLGFKQDEDVALLLRRLSELYPKLQAKVAGFKRFYVAFKVAQSIAEGAVRSRIEKEALKHALCLKLDASRAAPSDEFIREIAVNVLKLDERAVGPVLSTRAL